MACQTWTSVKFAYAFVELNEKILTNSDSHLDANNCGATISESVVSSDNGISVLVISKSLSLYKPHGAKKRQVLF
jgi:hypothetical protein